MSETPIAILARCQRTLQAEGIEDAQSVARILVCEVLHCDMHGLLMMSAPLTDSQAEELSRLVKRVLCGEPVQYIVGAADLMGLRFKVTRDVLIPRFDTETLIQWAIARAPSGGSLLDVGTGSGCIAISICKHRLDLKVSAGDISEAALLVAQENADQLGCDIQFTLGDLCMPYRAETFDVIISNPPYIGDSEWPALSALVKEHEPRLALYGGGDGLSVYRRLVSEAFDCLKPDGALGVEIGYDQADAVMALFSAQGFRQIRMIRDMEHRPRVVVGERGDRR